MSPCPYKYTHILDIVLNACFPSIFRLLIFLILSSFGTSTSGGSFIYYRFSGHFEKTRHLFPNHLRFKNYNADGMNLA